MLRGTTTFKCDDCGNRFTAMDIEWGATCFSCPMECTKCKSMHTYPAKHSIFGGLFWTPSAYKSIWESMEKDKRKGK